MYVEFVYIETRAIYSDLYGFNDCLLLSHRAAGSWKLSINGKREVQHFSHAQPLLFERINFGQTLLGDDRVCCGGFHLENRRVRATGGIDIS